MKPTPKPIEDIEVIYNDPLCHSSQYIDNLEVEYETVK